MKLNAVKFGLACAIVWVFGVLFIALAPYFGLWQEAYEVLTMFYYGFNNSSFLGSLVGVLWSFTDAFIGGFLIIYIYNKLDKGN